MKKAFFNGIALGILLLVVSSCAPRRVYTTASYGTLKSYTSKLPFEGEKQKATYVSATADFGRHPQENDLFRDKKFIFSTDVHHSVTARRYNYYFGIGAGAGSYKFVGGLADVIDSGEKQAFYAVRAKAGINYTYSRPKVDYRFIGLELSYLNEFGPYQDKLKTILREAPQATVVNPNSILSYNFYSEYVLKASDNSALTLGLFIGDLLNYRDTEEYTGNTAFSGFTVGLKIKRVEIFSVFESAEADIRNTKLGISYQF